MMKTLIYIWLLTWVSVSLADAPRDYRLLWAVREVATGHDPNPPHVMDENGNECIGPFSISRDRWLEVLRVYHDLGGTYTDCEKEDYSILVFRKYLDAFATPEKLGHQPTWEDKARVWKGGPDGWRDDRTIEYWHRVESAMGEAK